MSSKHPTVQVVRLRRTQTSEDRYGQPVYEETETVMPPALFQPGAMVEAIERGREPVVLAPTLYWRNQFPDILHTDRLNVLEETYKVIGEPQQWRGNKAAGLVVQLRSTKDTEREGNV